MANEYKYERVSFEPSRLNNGEFIPRISIVTSNGSNDESKEEKYRDFDEEDMLRILDFDNMPEPPPSDAIFGHLEFELDDDDTITADAPPKFPKRYFVIRGSYIFYFSTDDVGGIDAQNVSSQGRFQYQNAPKFKGTPLGVIPLERTVVEFPPGGRRCFREHAKTDAKNGYEMMIRHMGRGGLGATDTSGAVTNKRRAPAYIVCDTSGQRELWKKAIVIRADAHRKDTKLRPAGVTNIPSNAESLADAGSSIAGGRFRERGSIYRSDVAAGDRRVGGNISVLAGVIETEEQKDIDEALKHFGNSAFFEEADWVNEFFTSNDELESLATSRKLERWQTSIKKGLRGAVLEQYEYFVEASKEMTIMGREIANLKELVLKQVETVESMKHVSFELGALIPNKYQNRNFDNLEYPEDEEDLYSSDEDENLQDATKGRDSNNNARNELGGLKSQSRKTLFSDSTSSIDIPPYLENDVVEEIAAFIKESRYSNATDLLLKAKDEINDIMNQNEKVTDKKLSKRQIASLQRILRSIDNLTNRMCEHLSDGLRRKNDALRTLAKKERNDPLLANAPLVSPIALNDDAAALHLLVKLGRPLEAATAYSSRRSLLLNECLNEQPICHSSHSIDIVIYAAQISHSFFNSLAMAVEGFLDMFSENDKSSNMSDDQSEASSIYTGTFKSVPSNALAATCLWCDSETSKFASAFSTKVLGHLALSPRTGSASAISEKISHFEVSNDLTHFRKQLQVAEEMGEYEIAEKLRKKITTQEQEEKNNELNQIPKSSAEKDRKVAIEIAAKCIDQAFTFSTEFLNTIGLPITPRLAEYLRPRLKGTEAEIAAELEDKWESITFGWKEAEIRESLD